MAEFSRQLRPSLFSLTMYLVASRGKMARNLFVYLMNVDLLVISRILFVRGSDGYCAFL
jgi:hypothetical protein